MKYTSLSKGQGTVVLMIAVVAAVMISGLVAMVMVQNLPSIFGNFVNDAGLVAEAEMRKDNLEQNYIPLAAHYAVAEASWWVGISNRFTTTIKGQDDNDNSMPSDSEKADEVLTASRDTGDEGEEGQSHENRMNNVQTVSNYHIDGYIRDFSKGNCRVSMISDLKIYLGWKDDWINVTEPPSTSVDQLVNVTCSKLNKVVFSQGEKESFISHMGSNKFPDLSTVMDAAMTGAENVSEEIEANGNHQGQFTVNATHPSDSFCPPLSSSAAKDEARDKAMNKFYDGNMGNGHIDKISEIQQAIMKQAHGIGSGNKRGIIDAIKEAADGNKVCVPFTSLCFGFPGLEFLRNSQEWKVELINNETDTEFTNVYSYKCGCSGTLSCNPSSPDSDGEDEFGINSNNQCSRRVSSSGPSCQDEPSDDDYTYSSGSCNLDASESPAPSVCNSGSYNESEGYCDDASGTVTDTNLCTDSGSDQDFSFDDPSNSCVHDGRSTSPRCTDDDFSYSSGSCNFDHSGVSPSRQCSGSWKYNADATMKWEIDSIKVNVTMKDDERKIPTASGWKHLIISRNYYREFHNLNYIN